MVFKSFRPDMSIGSDIQKRLWDLQHSLESLRLSIKERKKGEPMEGMQTMAGGGGGKILIRNSMSEAADTIGVKERTLAKWLRDFDFGITVEDGGLTDHDILKIMEATKEISFAGKKSLTIDTSKVKKLTQKAKRSKRVPSVPDQGTWTPTSTELKSCLAHVSPVHQAQVREAFSKGYITARTAGRALGLGRSTVSAWARDGKIKPDLKLGKFSFYKKETLEKASRKFSIGKSRRRKTFNIPGQVAMFDATGKALGQSAPEAAGPVQTVTEALVRVPDRYKQLVADLLASGNWVTPQAAGQRVGLHHTTVRRWFEANEDRKSMAQRFGTCLLYPKVLVEDLAAEVEKKHAPASKSKAGEGEWVEIGDGVGRLLARAARSRRSNDPNTIDSLLEQVSELVAGLLQGLGEEIGSRARKAK